MKIVTGDTIWNKKNNIPNKYNYLSEDIDCEVLIIGGGITGALTAYYLTMEGIKTVLVEKNIIAYGSTCASTSILQYEIDTDLVGLRGLIGIENALKCFNETKKAVHEVENIVKQLDDRCGFSKRDCFYYTYKQNEVNYLKKEYNLRKENGFDVEYIDNSKAKNYFDFKVKGGIYSNNLAGEIDPYRFSHSLIRKSIENGLKVYENTEIIKSINNNNKIISKTNNGFKIQAKKVIIATGFEAKKYFNYKTAILSRTFTIATKPIKNFDGWHNRCIIRNTDNPYIYIRSTDDNRIIIGGEDENVGGIRSKVANLTQEDTLSYKKYETLVNKLKSYFPNIKNIETEYAFSGFFGESKDSLPYIGEHSDYPNYYFNLGFGSNGILYAIIGAKIIRDLYEGKNTHLKNIFRLNR